MLCVQIKTILVLIWILLILEWIDSAVLLVYEYRGFCFYISFSVTAILELCLQRECRWISCQNLESSAADTCCQISCQPNINQNPKGLSRLIMRNFEGWVFFSFFIYLFFKLTWCEVQQGQKSILLVFKSNVYIYIFSSERWPEHLSWSLKWEAFSKWFCFVEILQARRALMGLSMGKGKDIIIRI